MARGAWGLLAAAVLIVPGVAFGGLAPGLGGATFEEPVETDLAFDRAHVRGDIVLNAERGALLVEGPPAGFLMEARELLVRVVRVRSDYVDNPLTGDVFVVADEAEERHNFKDAQVRLLVTSAATVLYAFQDRGGRAAFALPLGEVRGEAFRATADATGVLAGEPGAHWSFEHAVPAPAFGVAHGMAGPFQAPLRRADVAGDFAVMVDYALLEAEQPGLAPLRVTVGKTADRNDHPLALKGPIPHYTAERAYAVLEARGATLRLEPGAAAARFVAPDPVYALDGHLRLSRASGAMRLGGGQHGLAQETLDLEGLLTVRPRAASGAGPFAPAPAVRAAVAGEARSATLGGQPLLRPLPPAVREASLLAGAVAVLAAAWGTLHQVLAPVLLPMYARLSGRDLLSNRHRLQLYGAILDHPFIHLRELQRATGLGFGTVAYHVTLLKRERFVASVRARREERFYVPSARFNPRAMGSLAALAAPPRRRLAEAVLRGTDTQETLAQALVLSRGQVCRHLAMLEAAGLVEAFGARGKRYAPTPLLRAWAAEQALVVGSPRPFAAPAAPSPAGASAAASASVA